MKISMSIEKIEMTVEVIKLLPGDKVLWLYTAPTGWNPSMWVNATVVKVTAKRVTIDAELKNGSTLRRSVTLEKLKFR